MNNQFNFNSQFNNQPSVSNGGNPTHKRKFFTSSLVDDVNMDAVGGTTSGNVVSWSAGSPGSNRRNQAPTVQQDTLTGASMMNTGSFGPQYNGMQQPNQMMNTAQVPIVNQTPQMAWQQPVQQVTEMPMLNQAVQEQPFTQTMPVPVPQIETNSMGMALAEPASQAVVDDNVEMLNEVNGDVYVEEPEVLDFEENVNKGVSTGGVIAPSKEDKPITFEAADNSSEFLAEKIREEQKFQEDQLSQGNFSSILGNNNTSTLAPGMPKPKDELNVTAPLAVPVAPVAPAAAAVPIAAPVLNAMPKPDLGVTPTQSNANAYNDSMMASTPIFQAATEVLDEEPIQGQAAIAPQFQNKDLQKWVGDSKPDSEVDVNSYSGVKKKEEPKEDKKLKKKLRKKKTEPVPEEVTKKVEAPIRVDNMASEIVGSKYTHFVMSPFNFAALLFGPAYMAYRRMPLAAVIVYLINAAAVFYLPTMAPDEYYTMAQFGAIIGFALLFALSVNRMIVANARFKAKSIVRKYGASGDKEKAVIMAQRMGHPSLVMAILFYIFAGVIAGLLLTTVLKDSKLANLYNIYLDAYQNGGTVEYNGFIKYSDYDVSKVISLKVPDGFSKVEEMKYTYITESDGKYNDCSFHIYAVDRFINGDTFIRKMAEFNGDAGKVKTNEINGIDWTNYYTEDSMYKIYYRGFTYKNHAIVFEYKSGKEATEGVCDQLYVKVMDGISIKES